MKKLLIMITLIIYLLGIKASADESIDFETRKLLFDINIIDETYFSNADTVTREESLIAIMRTIGVTDEEIDLLGSTSLYCFADTPSHSYFGCAYLAEIAYGVKCVVDYPTYRTEHTMKNVDYFFFPKQTVTIKECLAFMIRCLQSDEIDFDLTLERANDYGLINEQDVFIQNPNSSINQDDFLVLLERLLQQKRYKYYGRENGFFKMDGNIDEERTVTYIEMFQR